LPPPCDAPPGARRTTAAASDHDDARHGRPERLPRSSRRQSLTSLGRSNFAAVPRQWKSRLAAQKPLAPTRAYALKSTCVGALFRPDYRRHARPGKGDVKTALTDIRGRGHEQRCDVRQARTRPLIADLEPWLREKLGVISQKSKLAEAIRYALARWEGLTRFLDDGRIEIDSNTVERSIRPIALNRKNALFAGSHGGGENWAVIASLVETCKLNGVDPYLYFANALAKIVNGHLNCQIDDLLPWAYAKGGAAQSRGENAAYARRDMPSSLKQAHLMEMRAIA
jgi:hypothetical protein